jgi:hypothetical protein
MFLNKFIQMMNMLFIYYQNFFNDDNLDYKNRLQHNALQQNQLMLSAESLAIAVRPGLSFSQQSRNSCPGHNHSGT